MSKSVSRILPNLFLSDAKTAGSLEILDEYKITHILNISDAVINVHGRNYLHIDILDNLQTNISDHFDDCYNFIVKGDIVLVHCVAGISRSATIILFYLMKHTGMTLREAYYHVKEVRNIRPNRHFLEQLIEYEKKIRFVSSISLLEMLVENHFILYDGFYTKAQVEQMILQNEKENKSKNF